MQILPEPVLFSCALNRTEMFLFVDTESGNTVNVEQIKVGNGFFLLHGHVCRYGVITNEDHASEWQYRNPYDIILMPSSVATELQRLLDSIATSS